jgi:hypothetical protein
VSAKPQKIVFVGGVGRSGTSKVYATLIESPRIDGPPQFESKFLIDDGGLLDLHRNFTSCYSPARFAAAAERFRLMMTMDLRPTGRFGAFPLDQFIEPEYIASITGRFLASLRAVEDDAEAREAKFREAAQSLVGAIFALYLHPESYLCEKTPHNLLCFDFLNHVFPTAKLVHVIRDPRAIASSLQRQNWAPDGYEDCCRWVRSVFSTYDLKLRQGAIALERVLEVRFEDLAADEPAQRRRIAEFLGLAEDDLVPFRLDAARMSAWKGDVPSEQLEWAGRYLRQDMERYGYEL